MIIRAEIQSIDTLPGYNSLIRVEGEIPNGYVIAEMQEDGGEKFTPSAPGRLLLNGFCYDVQPNCTIWLTMGPIADGQ